jgi:hypothetical protein
MAMIEWSDLLRTYGRVCATHGQLSHRGEATECSKEALRLRLALLCRGDSIVCKEVSCGSKGDQGERAHF